MLRLSLLGLLVAGACGCGGRETSRTVPTPAAPEAQPLLRREPTPDPRLTADTPFRNVRPDVKYVGDAACATCHPVLTETYHRHPMGRSASIPKTGEGPERYDAAAHLPVETTAFRLEVARDNGRVEHVVTTTLPEAAGVPPYRTPVDVAIGSGTRGRSYLTCTGGSVWQSPLSWYSQAGRWDVSPGFVLSQSGRRAISADCLFCHVNRVEPVPGSLNRYDEPLLREQPAVGCERCHGPGQLHVAERTDGRVTHGPDHSIVNPKHLPPDLRQDVCRQCHLLGEHRQAARGREAFDFRPGLPLDDFIRVFVRHPARGYSGKSVGQFEQIEASRCHAGSGGRLTCTSCHDPHLSPEPAAKPAFYRAKCQACHTPPAGKDCSAPLADRTAAADNCVTCHMPRGDSANIVHAAVTDHRLFRRPATAPAGMTKSLPVGATAMIPYRDRPHPDRDRDLGLALAVAAFRLESENLRQSASRQSLERLTAAVQARPADESAWLSLVALNQAYGGPAERLAASRMAAHFDPPSEQGLAALASAIAIAPRPRDIVPTAERLVALNPSAVDNRVHLIKALVLVQDWQRVEEEARKALAVYPLEAQARLFLAAALAKQGKAAEGNREAAAAIALHATLQARIDAGRWFAGQLR